VREGRLRAIARPLMRGRRTQVWEAQVMDDKDRIVAQGKVRLLALEADSAVAGETVRIKSSHG
jgi:acyl-coenzyme A thioesterase PaaI-like protein